jgi:hypothetical protein
LTITAVGLRILVVIFVCPYCVYAELRYIYWFSQLGFWASVAQLAEQLICNQQVVGSSPSAGFVPEWF